MTRELSSHVEYYAAAFAPYMREHRLGRYDAGGGAAAGDFSDPPVSDLVVIRAVSDGMSQLSDLGGGRFRGRSPKGSLFLVAPETATEKHVQNSQPSAALPFRPRRCARTSKR